MALFSTGEAYENNMEADPKRDSAETGEICDPGGRDDRGSLFDYGGDDIFKFLPVRYDPAGKRRERTL